MVNCFRSNSYYNLKRTLSLILLFYHYPTAKVRKKNEFIIFSLLKRHISSINMGLGSAKEKPQHGQTTGLPPAQLQPLPRPLSEWNNPTQPPPRGGVPNGSRLGKGILNTKRASLRCEETPFSLQGNALLDWRRAFP